MIKTVLPQSPAPDNAEYFREKYHLHTLRIGSIASTQTMSHRTLFRKTFDKQRIVCCEASGEKDLRPVRRVCYAINASACEIGKLMRRAAAYTAQLLNRSSKSGRDLREPLHVSRRRHDVRVGSESSDQHNAQPQPRIMEKRSWVEQLFVQICASALQCGNWGLPRHSDFSWIDRTELDGRRVQGGQCDGGFRFER